ncbi:MAG: MFS transporter [Actinomycetota bacterium]
MTQLSSVMDASSVNVALPSIGADLDISPNNLAWIVGAYTLTFGSLLLLGGRLADVLGRRRMFIAGNLLFGAAALAGGLAQSELVLYIARGMQGVGSAIIIPAALSIITTSFAEGPERNQALAVWGAVSGAGAALGVLLGGGLTDVLSWRWVLLINLPVVVYAVIGAFRLLQGGTDPNVVRSFDLTGAALVTGGFGVLVFAFIDAEQAGWGSTQTVSLLIGGVATLVAFGVWETRCSHPLLPLSIFKLRTLTGSNLAGLTAGAGMFGVFFVISVYTQTVLGFSPIRTGVAYLPLSIAAFVVAGATGALIGKFGFKVTLSTGLTLVTGSMIWFSQVSADGSYLADVLGPSTLLGIGLGMTFVSLTNGGVAGTRPDQAGLASGLINTSQQIGGALGVAVMSTLSFATFDQTQPDPVALVDGMQDAFVFAAAAVFVGLLVALFVVRQEDAPDPDEIPA